MNRTADENRSIVINSTRASASDAVATRLFYTGARARAHSPIAPRYENRRVLRVRECSRRGNKNRMLIQKRPKCKSAAFIASLFLSPSRCLAPSQRRAGVKTRPCPARGTCELTHVRQGESLEATSRRMRERERESGKGEKKKERKSEKKACVRLHARGCANTCVWKRKKEHGRKREEEE